MGNINKFRRLDGRTANGRGPSFLVCALFIGLCIISVSYYNLSTQYNKLYDSMADLVKQQKLLENHLEKTKAEQLKTSQDAIKEVKQQLLNKTKQLTELTNLNIKTKDELIKKTQELNDLQIKNKELETLKTQLNDDNVKYQQQIEELKNKLFPLKNQQPEINLQDNKSNLDPKRKIVDNQPIDKDNERSKEIKTKDDDKKQTNSKNDRHDPVVNLLNKDKNQSS